MLGCQNKLEASTYWETKQNLFMVYLSRLQYPDFVGGKVFCLSKHHCICSELLTNRFFFHRFLRGKKPACAVDQLSIIKEINVHVLNLFSNKTLVYWIIWANVLALGFTLLKYVIAIHSDFSVLQIFFIWHEYWILVSNCKNIKSWMLTFIIILFSSHLSEK